MTSLVDVQEASGNLSQIEKDLGEAVVARAQNVSDGNVEGESGDAGDESQDFLPAKLRGKSLRELADMYQNLESLNGRMANETGQLRSLTDRLLDLKRTTDLGNNGAAQPTKVEITSADILERPTEALERFASARETALETRLDARLARLETATVEANLLNKHPDVEAVAASKEFVQWVQQSPTRMRAANAAKAGDAGAADDLLTEFKATARKAGGKGKQPVQDENLDAARAASLETGNGNSLDTGSKKSGKVYRRADLIKLRIEKPDLYDSDDFQAEIMAAYAEGRVK